MHEDAGPRPELDESLLRKLAIRLGDNSLVDIVFSGERASARQPIAWPDGANLQGP
jgi:hypothetical protein